MAAKKFVLGRVLVACVVSGVDFAANDLIESDAATIKHLEKMGQVDSSTGAVKYCLEKLKAKPIRAVLGDEVPGDDDGGDGAGDDKKTGTGDDEKAGTGTDDGTGDAGAGGDEEKDKK